MTSWVMLEITGFTQRTSLAAFAYGRSRIVWQKCRLSHYLGHRNFKQTSHPKSVPRARRGINLAAAFLGFAKKSSPPEELLCFSAPFGACFPSTPSSGRGKIPTQLLIIRGGHGRHPTPTSAFVLSNYNLSGKLLKTGTEAAPALINSPLTLTKLKRRNVKCWGLKVNFLRTAFYAWRLWKEDCFSVVKENACVLNTLFCSLFVLPQVEAVTRTTWTRRDRALEAHPTLPFATTPELSPWPGQWHTQSEWMS